MHWTSVPRLLTGVLLVSLCALLPISWARAPRALSRILAIPSGFTGAYEDEDPIRLKLRVLQQGALLTYEGDRLSPALADAWEREYLLPTGRSGEELLRILNDLQEPFGSWGFRCRTGEGGRVVIRLLDPPGDWRPLQKAIREAAGLEIHPARAELRLWPRVEVKVHLGIRTGSALPDGTPVPSSGQSPAQTVMAYLAPRAGKLLAGEGTIDIEKDDQLLIRTRRPSPSLIEKLKEVCPNGFTEIQVEQSITLRTLRSQGDPALALDLRDTLKHLRARPSARFGTLGRESQSEVDSSRIVLHFPRMSYVVLEACVVPLGEPTRLHPPALHGWDLRSAEEYGDVEREVREGRLAAILVDPPRDLPSVELGLEMTLAAVLSADVPISNREKILECAAGRTVDLTGVELRILCRRSERVSREEAFQLAERLRLAGARPVLHAVTGDEFCRRLARHRFDVAISAFPQTVSSEPGRWWRSSSPLNLAGISNPEIDHGIDDLDATFDSDERELLRGKIARLLAGASVWHVYRNVPVRLCGLSEGLLVD